MNKNKLLILLLLFTFILGISLSLMRNPGADESFYLRETSLISQSIQKFQWFGNESVGLHGFLFKLPAALLFLVTGPSIFIATLTNVILGVGIIYLVYLIFLDFTHSMEWTLMGSFLMSTNVVFLHSLPTYLREYPALFSLLLLLYAVLKKKTDWIIGIIFLLLIDAKEGIFFITLIGYILWLFYIEILLKKKKFAFRNVRDFFVKTIKVTSPALLYIGLMLFTGIVPLNVKLTQFIGGNYGGIPFFVQGQVQSVRNQYNNEIKQVKPSESLGASTKVLNEIKTKTTSPQKPDLTQSVSPLKQIKNQKSLSSKFLYKLTQNLSMYIQKIFYFRTFSLSSMPRFLIAIALVCSFLFLKLWRKQTEHKRLFFLFLFWIYLLIFILRASHGRYLLPIIPIIILFFIFFLRDVIKRKKFAFLTILGTSLFISLGMAFEKEYVLMKIFINIVICAGLFLVYYSSQKNSSTLPLIRRSFIFTIGIFAVCINLSASYLLPGQIGTFKKWGYCAEFNKIANFFDEDEKIWINADSQLFRFFRNELHIIFVEHDKSFFVKEWIPKQKMINWSHKKTVYSFNLETQTQFFNRLKAENIEKIVLLVSTSEEPGFKFKNQDMLSEIQKMPFLNLQSRLELKNKILYIYGLTR